MDWSDDVARRQPCDKTARRYRAFLDYLEIPGNKDRGLPVLAMRYGVSLGTIRAWARVAYWSERAACLEAETDAARARERQVELAEQREDIERNIDIQEEHKSVLRRMRDLLTLAVSKHLSEEGSIEAPVMSLKEAIALSRVVLPLERIYSGDRGPGASGVDLSGVSDKDLAELERILGG